MCEYLFAPQTTTAIEWLIRVISCLLNWQKLSVGHNQCQGQKVTISNVLLDFYGADWASPTCVCLVRGRLFYKVSDSEWALTLAHAFYYPITVTQVLLLWLLSVFKHLRRSRYCCCSRKD